MFSKLEICNKALLLLGLEPLISLDDDCQEAYICKEFYKLSLLTILRSFAWSCVTKRKLLARSAETPDFGYKYAYNLPNDCLKLFKLNDRKDEFVIEGKQILTDAIEVKVIYIKSPENESELSADIVLCTALQLAVNIGFKLNANRSLVENLYNRLQQIDLPNAKNNDAVESLPPPESNSWLDEGY